MILCATKGEHFLREMESVASRQGCQSTGILFVLRTIDLGDLCCFSGVKGPTAAADQWGPAGNVLGLAGLSLPRLLTPSCPCASPCVGFRPWPVLPVAVGTPDKPLNDCVLVALGLAAALNILV